MTINGSVEPAFFNVVAAAGATFSIVITGGTVKVEKEGDQTVVSTNLVGYHFHDNKPARVKYTFRGAL
jgi:hypothetical protein